MLVSELIEELERFKQQYGDVSVVTKETGEDGYMVVHEIKADGCLPRVARLVSRERNTRTGLNR